MGVASPHILPIHLAQTAEALGTQHGPTEQTQSGMLLLIICGLGTPEDHTGGEDVNQLQWEFH